MKVLIAVDNSKFASEVIDEISKRKWSDETEFLILDVVETCSLPASTEEFLHECRILLATTVANLSRKLPHHKVSGEVVEGDAKLEIAGFADQWGADLIIMGAHGESGIKRHGVSNVVVSVLSHAPCSVEVIRPRHHKEAALKKSD